MVPTPSARLIQPCFDEACPPWTDTDGNRIEAHAAGMLQSPLDGKWYWYGETAKGTVESDGSMPHGVNCYSSTDLAGPWQFEGQVLKQSVLESKRKLMKHRLVLLSAASLCQYGPPWLPRAGRVQTGRKSEGSGGVNSHSATVVT